MNLDIFADQGLNLLPVLLGVVFLIFGLMSAVLIYHWTRYGIHRATVQSVIIIYFFVALILLYSIAQSANHLN